MHTTVVGLEKMLRRLIGEDIELVVQRGAELGAVRVDVGQMEQVIMNLVVNARDAMPQGGRLTIEVRNIELPSTQTAEVAVPAGRYVTVAVRDTGVGMDTETRRRLFEPFFTTKDVGKGTGLGLSTCYGILKQSGGHIDVASEPHRGSTFTIYLPRVDEAFTCPEETPCPDSGDGHETILVVEDDPHVRSALRRILARRGYQVLTARKAAQALELAQRHETTIDLVLSDVVMPGTSGPELIERIEKRFGRMRTLLMSGYIDHGLLQRADCPLGTSILQKPFLPEALAIAVRQVLDASPVQTSNAAAGASA